MPRCRAAVARVAAGGDINKRQISLPPALPRRMTKPTTRLSKVFPISLSILGEARAEKRAVPQDLLHWRRFSRSMGDALGRSTKRASRSSRDPPSMAQCRIASLPIHKMRVPRKDVRTVILNRLTSLTSRFMFASLRKQQTIALPRNDAQCKSRQFATGANGHSIALSSSADLLPMTCHTSVGPAPFTSINPSASQSNESLIKS